MGGVSLELLLNLKNDKSVPSEEVELPEELEELIGIPLEKNHQEAPALSYSFAEEKFLQEQAAIAYAPLSYTENKGTFSFNNDNEYFCTPIPEGEAETMTTEEAEVMVAKIQYATVLCSMSELDHTERKKFATWTMFNVTDLKLFHTLNALTNDVDYSKTF